MLAVFLVRDDEPFFSIYNLEEREGRERDRKREGERGGEKEGEREREREREERRDGESEEGAVVREKQSKFKGLYQ